MQRLRGIDDGDDDNNSGPNEDRIGRRRTIHNLEKQKQKKRVTGTLDVAFKKRFFNMTAEGGEGIEGELPVSEFVAALLIFLLPVLDSIKRTTPEALENI